MKQILLLLLVFTASLAACQHPSDQQSTDSTSVAAVGATAINEVLSVNAFEAKLVASPGIQLVDVRTPQEFSDGHIKGAVNINFYDDNFTQQLEQALDKSQPVMIYCRSGKRSGKAAQRMASLGFQEVYDLKGGYLAWPK
ncbi:MAG: rhodanese-like domain-containing protein [Phaeodactylibacter sp.]|nr:rhodanese-like domain-containing protein [Phaeodactylibacter sp.]MCB9272761.1 rhodanese-like domain-containing protein [Lewinellaceae bacterium]